MTDCDVTLARRGVIDSGAAGSQCGCVVAPGSPQRVVCFASVAGGVTRHPALPSPKTANSSSPDALRMNRAERRRFRQQTEHESENTRLTRYTDAKSGCGEHQNFHRESRMGAYCYFQTGPGTSLVDICCVVDLVTAPVCSILRSSAVCRPKVFVFNARCTEGAVFDRRSVLLSSLKVASVSAGLRLPARAESAQL